MLGEAPAQVFQRNVKPFSTAHRGFSKNPGAAGRAQPLPGDTESLVPEE